MATLKELETYIDYEFSSGAITGKDYLQFQTKYINYIKAICKQNGWIVENIGRNHYTFSLFITNNKGKYVYLSISDVRGWYNAWYERVLIRYALHNKHYSGGKNQYTSLPMLEQKLQQMLEN